MKKKTTLTFALLACCVLLFVSCDVSSVPQTSTQSLTSVQSQKTEVPSCNGNHQYEAVVTPPQVNKEGYTTYTCKICLNSYIDDHVPATGSLGLAYEVNADGKTCTVTGVGGCNDNKIYIPAQIDGYTVTAIGKSAFKNHIPLSYISIPDTVTSIGKYAFSGCRRLTSIKIPDGVTSIEDNTFKACNKLMTVSIGKNVTSIGESAFQSCTALTSIVLPDSLITIKEGAFEQCTALADITFGQELTTIGEAAFSNCTDLKTISLPDNVKEIGPQAFSSCDLLKSITFGKSLTSIGSYAFRYCKQIKSLVFPDTLTTIGFSAFDSCTGLSTVVLGKEIKSIANSAFTKCYNIKSVFYGKTAAEWTTDVSVGSYNDKLTSATIYFYSENPPTEVAPYWHQVDGIPVIWNVLSYTSNGDGTCYVSGAFVGGALEIPSTSPDGDQVVSIGSSAFYECIHLVSVTFPDSVTTIDSRAFSGCTKLEKVTFGKNLKSIAQRAFGVCNSLTEIYLPDGMTSVATYAFTYSQGLKTVYIPHSLEHFDVRSLSDCTNLEWIFYEGTADEWTKITIGSHGIPLPERAHVYYYSEEEPTTDGYYWRYIDGVPRIWL